jgi:hypothetical protein
MHRLRGRPFIALRIPTFASTTVQMLWQCARVFFFLTRGAATPPDVTIRHMATHELLTMAAPTRSETCRSPHYGKKSLSHCYDSHGQDRGKTLNTLPGAMHET